MMDTTEQEQDNAMEQNTDAGTGTGPPRPEPRQLTRSRDDVIIAGVASGLAKHLNIDPLIVRIGFVAATFAGGLGLLLYLVGWVLIPEEGSDRALGVASGDHPLRAIPPWIAATALGVAAVILISEIDIWSGGVFFWALLLIGGGVLLYRMDSAPPRPAKRSPATGTPPPSAPPEGGGPSGTQPLPVVTESPRPRPPKVRSYLGRYTIAAILLVLGVTAMLDVAGAFTLEAGQYPALALIVLGGGLLVGTIAGRARGLIVLGIFFILPIAMGASLIHVPIEGGAGDRSYTPFSTAELDRDFHLVAGRMVFDLDGLEWGAEPVELTATAVAGQIQIYVPRGVTVDLDGRVSAGQVELFGLTQDGYNAEIDATDSAAPGSPILVIDAEVSFGNIEIVRSAATAKGTL